MIGRLAVLLLLAAASPLSAQLTPWEAEGGRVVIHFLDDVLEQAGLSLLELEETVVPGDAFDEEQDGDLLGFRIIPESDLMALRALDGTFQPYGVLGGSIQVSGGFLLADQATGRGMDFQDFAFRTRIVRNDGPGGVRDPDYFFLNPHHDPDFDAFKLCYVKVYFLDDQGYQPPDGSGGGSGGGSTGGHQLPNQLRIKAWDLIITPELAQVLGRPDLDGVTIGYGKIEADVVEYTGHWEHPEGQNIFTPYQGGGGSSGLAGTGFLDVKLGILSGINQVGHVGTFPDGRAGLSMSTTSCNAGTVNATWLAAMNEDHPGIAMALFRELDGRFEQVGVSWIKHGFFALSNSQCTTCQNPSNGTFLGVGCSDTYGSSNNADRFWLGPRDEWNAFAGTWTCLGSYFDGTPADCVRSVNGGGQGAVNHRLEAFDADLDNPGAQYFYEANYLVRDDQDVDNNIGSRECTMSWNGFSWQFTTPGGGNPLVEGPTLLNRWGDVRTIAGLMPHDGNVVLSATSEEISPGIWRYEYALYNWSLDRRVNSISFPVPNGTSNHYFHDIDNNVSNDWVVTTDSNRLTWTFEGVPMTGVKVAGPLEFGTLYNFGFTSGRPPASRNAVLGINDPGLGGELLAVGTVAPDFFELTASKVSPAIGENITVLMRGGTDLGLAVVLSVNGTPITPTFIGGLQPFVAGAASFPVVIPASVSGVEVAMIAGDVSASLNIHQISNVMDLIVQ
jgi:hypothetical protein